MQNDTYVLICLFLMFGCGVAVGFALALLFTPAKHKVKPEPPISEIKRDDFDEVVKTTRSGKVLERRAYLGNIGYNSKKIFKDSNQ